MFDPTPILSGNRRALARLLTHIENADAVAAEALAALFPRTGHAHVIGVTGAPGCGKSSLVNVLAKAMRRAGRTVAIVAVDPSSPFTGGALLGDRLRMRGPRRRRGGFHPLHGHPRRAGRPGHHHRRHGSRA